MKSKLYAECDNPRGAYNNNGGERNHSLNNSHNEYDALLTR